MSTAGETLRMAREARGYSLEDIEEKLNIRSKYIFALEEEDFEALPGKVYVLGYVKNYARFLSLDVDAITAEVKEKIDVVDAMAITTIELSPVALESPKPEVKETSAPRVAQPRPTKGEQTQSCRSNRRERNVQANFRVIYLMLGLLALMGLLAFIGTRNWGI